MTTLWLWLNSTELNWTLNVRVVDGNCFALHYLLSVWLSLYLLLSRSLPFGLLARFICLSQSRSFSLPLSRSALRFLYRTLNSNGGLVSGCTHTRAHAHWAHTYKPVVSVWVSILLSLPISIRKRAQTDETVRCVLFRSALLSLSLSQKKTTTSRSAWIPFEFLLCQLDLPEHNNQSNPKYPSFLRCKSN